MKVRMIDTGAVVEYSDSYAMRLIEQGKAVTVDDGTPPTPTPTPIDPSHYGAIIESLQAQTLALQSELDAAKQSAEENAVFANMFQSISQAQERQLEYLEEHLQEEIDAAAGL